MSESMQAPSYSRRIWLAFALSRGKGWAAAKAEPVSAHRWRAGEYGKGRVPARLGRAGEKEETAMKGSMGIDHITLCVKNLAAAEHLFTKILGFDVIWSARDVGSELSSMDTVVVQRGNAKIALMQGNNKAVSSPRPSCWKRLRSFTRTSSVTRSKAWNRRSSTTIKF